MDKDILTKRTLIKDLTNHKGTEVIEIGRASCRERVCLAV